MAYCSRGGGSRLKRLLFWRRHLGTRAAFALEFAMVGPLFIILLFICFEVSYDLFMQEVLDNTMQLAARQVQIGNAQGATSGNFVSTDFCPNVTAGGLLNCNNVYVRIEKLAFPGGTCTAAQDVFDGTSGAVNGTGGAVPVSGGVLQLGSFYSGASTQGSGTTMGLSNCATESPDTGFCNAGPQELILMTAIYVAPSFLAGLINPVKYNGRFVRAEEDTVGFITEAFQNTSSPTSQC